MLPGDSTVLGTAGSGGDVFAAGLRGFFAAFLSCAWYSPSW